MASPQWSRHHNEANQKLVQFLARGAGDAHKCGTEYVDIFGRKICEAFIYIQPIDYIQRFLLVTQIAPYSR